MQNCDARAVVKIDMANRDIAKVIDFQEQQQQMIQATQHLTRDILQRVENVPSMHATLLRSNEALQSWGSFLKEIQKSPSLQRFVHISQSQG